MTSPDLSIVVAAWPDSAGLSKLLAALGDQIDERVEVFVVSSAGPGSQALSPHVRWLEVATGLIPHYWAAGIRESRGDVVAITTTQFRPDPGWVDAIRSSHARLDSLAIGGPITAPRGKGPVAWATYFLRYSAFLNYSQECTVPDLAGDNASYKRTALNENAAMLRLGFWELDLHRKLHREGKCLVFVPEMQVTQIGSFGFFRFLHQRFEHGLQFGSARFSNEKPWMRLPAIFASPLIPLVLLGKVTGRVLRSRRNLGRFLLSMPALASFVAAWSFGETLGYLAPRRTNSWNRKVDQANESSNPVGMISHGTH